MSVHASVEVKLDRHSAFQEFVDELAMALSRLGIAFEPGPSGHVHEAGAEIGRVTSWQPDERVVLVWHAADWQPDEKAAVELRLEEIPEGTRITLVHEGLEKWVGNPGSQLTGWFASEVAAPLLRAAGRAGLGDWLTDRNARRPSGSQARQIYRDPLYHRPNFMAIMKALALTPRDYLLEVGCGGGAFLADALKTGCRAAAVDHSPDMVRLAREVNHDAIQTGRLEIREASAALLPFPDGVFTCAVMTGVFGFVSKPGQALSEVARVLAPGGRFALFTGSKELRGTPAAPEPIAARLRFYEDAELEELARQAGFGEARVERPDFQAYAREAGVPQEAWMLFTRGYGQLLLALR
jgi:SAM-dependent methyltransferase